MGVERAITRWHIQRQLAQMALAQGQARLEQLASEVENQAEREALTQQVTEAERRLHDAGDCPRPMMG